MAQRDYVQRGSKNKTKGNKTLLWLLLAILLVGSFAFGLYFLKNKADKSVHIPTKTDTQPKSQLPSRPEETWSYIKDLETREIPVDDSQKSLEKNMQLTAEQKKILLQMENDRKQAQAVQTTQAESTVVKEETKPNKQQETSKVVDTVKVETSKETKKEAPVKKAETQVAAGKFGLQCGAFKNKPQAENLQARLAMQGLNAKVNSSADWNRVVVGPVGDRSAAVKAQDQAKSIASCVIIGM